MICCNRTVIDMSEFKIVISPEAEDDIEGVYCYIAFEIMYPMTAERYREGILEAIDRLAVHADIFAISSNKYLRRLYGADVRTVYYKKITIVYNVVKNIVLIRRVMASSLIQ